jgi:hypothetical protein
MRAPYPEPIGAAQQLVYKQHQRRRLLLIAS